MTIRTVTTDGEWDTEVAAAISGDTIEVSGSSFTQRTISGKSGLTIASANSSGKLPSVKIAGTISGITFDSLNLQMTGWPKTYGSMFVFDTGAFSDVTVNGCTFRHGYTGSYLDFDQEADLDEYVRVDNVQTATTTSATYALNWDDPTATTGWIEFFNRGSQTVYAKTGGAGVAATTGGFGETTCPAGTRTRISARNPTTDTHIAIITGTSTSQVNARAEVGLYYYLADAFSSSGGATASNIVVEGCTFHQLANAMKQWPTPSGSNVVMDNQFDAVYMDIIALGVRPSAQYRILRNVMCIPFCRSGIPEDQFGDAGDPHGDQLQMFGTNTGIIENVYSAGNRQYRQPTRGLAGIGGQGMFWTDNTNDPSYDKVFSISDVIIGGAINSLVIGDPGDEAVGGFVFGATVVDANNVATGTGAVRSNNTQGVVVDSSIVQYPFVEQTGSIRRNNTLILDEIADPAAVFPDIADLATADDRASIELAVTPAAEGVGLGAAATANAIDWVTTDAEDVILWENVASGLAWDEVVDIVPGVVYEFPLARVWNRRASQAVVAGAGVEWRSVDTDGTTEIQDWTTSSGTIEPDQFVQVRKSSSFTPLGVVDIELTVNGFVAATTITTKLVLANPFQMNGSAFRDTVNTPASTSVMELEWKGQLNTTPGANANIMTQDTLGGPYIDTLGQLRGGAIRDSANTVIGTFTLAQVLTQDVPITVNLLIDLAGLSASISLNGTVIQTITLSANTGQFLTNRKICFGTTSSAGITGPLPSDTYTEYFKAWLTTSSVRTLRKEISVAAQGSVSGVNSDAWKVSGTIIAAPDTEAPVLSGMSIVADSPTDITFHFATNDSNGTAYWYVSTSATPPSGADLIAGTGSVDYGSFAVTAVGTQTDVTVSGLSPGQTYYVHALHIDAATNASDILTGSIAVPGGGGGGSVGQASPLALSIASSCASSTAG